MTGSRRTSMNREPGTSIRRPAPIIGSAGNRRCERAGSLRHPVSTRSSPTGILASRHAGPLVGKGFLPRGIRTQREAPNTGPYRCSGFAFRPGRDAGRSRTTGLAVGMAGVFCPLAVCRSAECRPVTGSARPFAITDLCAGKPDRKVTAGARTNACNRRHSRM